MAEINTREELDKALKNTTYTLLMLSGTEDGTWASEVHAHANKIQDSWCLTFWVRDLSILTQEERDTTFAKGGRYVVLCRGKNEKGEKAWLVSDKGDLTALLTSAQKPATKAILDAFATCKS